MDSFREQLGEDWLRYQHHLETSTSPPTNTPAQATVSTLRPPTSAQTTVCDGSHTSTPSNASPGMLPATPPLVPNGRCAPTPSPPLQNPGAEKATLGDTLACVSPALTSSPSGSRDRAGEPDMETESTLRWGEHSRDSTTDSTLERSGTDASALLALSPRDEEEEEEEEDRGGLS